MKKLASLMVGLLLCGCTAFASETGNVEEARASVAVTADKVQVNQVFDYVYDPGVYNALDFELGKAALAKVFGGEGGKCTAVAKNLPNGDTVVGRNMDFYITHNPAYIIRTKGVKGQYDTIGVAYAKTGFPINEDVKVHGLTKQPAQTNFYVTKSLYKQQHYKAGMGRYATVMEGVKDVKTEADMLKLIKKVSYFQSNFPDICQYDPRTELVEDNSKWSTDYILDPKNQAEVQAKLQNGAAKLRKMTRKEIMDNGKYWESTFTHLINCNKKTMTVRFFEDEAKVITLDFDK